MSLVTWRRVIYAIWLISALCVRFEIFSFLTASMFKVMSYDITFFFLLTSLVILLITGFLAEKMNGWVLICSRSSGLMMLTVFIAVLGILTAIDLVVAVVTHKEPFLISYLFNLFSTFLP